MVVALEEEMREGELLKECLIETGAYAYVESCAVELLPLLHATAETMEYPRQSGLHLLANGKQFIDGLYAMDDEGLADEFAQTDVLTEDFYLLLYGGGAVLLVQPRLAYHHDLGMQSSDEESRHLGTPIVADVPGMQPHGIEVSGLRAERIGRELHDGFAGQGWMMMGMDVVNHCGCWIRVRDRSPIRPRDGSGGYGVW